MLESGMRIVGILAADKAKAVSRPEKLRKSEEWSVSRTSESGRDSSLRRSSLSHDDGELAFPRCVLEECFDSFRVSNRENEFTSFEISISSPAEGKEGQIFTHPEWIWSIDCSPTLR